MNRAIGLDYDVSVIGSGFGGSVTALRLSEKGYRVAVFETGKRWDAADLPRTNWDARRFFWFPSLGMRGIQRLSLLNDVLVLSGCGVGGGSLVWANVCYEPQPAAFAAWSEIDWPRELTPFYDQARRMLGVEDNPHDTNSDLVLQAVARHMGISATYRRTPVAVHFGETGAEVPDPYFGGAGPTRTGCIECGGCMVGCRFNAKNSLDRNYLYLAEQLGAVIHPQREVIDVEPLPGAGYRVVSQRPGAWLERQKRAHTAAQVVFSAGALGTGKLLHMLRRRRRLPLLSERLGDRLRTNSEALVGAMAAGHSVDYSQGVAITSSIHPDDRTHIEVVRYPRGSNSMGLLSTILVEPGPGPRWIRFLAAAARRPDLFLRSLSVHHWSERTVILLVMQSHDNSLRMRVKETRLGPRVTTKQDTARPNPTHLEVAAVAARTAAAVIGGYPGSSINEAVLDVPMTAHLIGGACVGSTPQRGVVDPYQRVYGYDGLHVADASVIGANLGANPSLTITAMTERAMAMWPNRGDPDPRPPMGSSYEPVAPVAPHHPAVAPHAPAALR